MGSQGLTDGSGSLAMCLKGLRAQEAWLRALEALLRVLEVWLMALEASLIALEAWWLWRPG